MNPVSVPVAVIGGITLYVGVYHFFLYLKRQVRNPVDLSFALTCFSMVLYDIFAVCGYNSHALAEGILWQRAQVATLSLIGATFIWFTVDYAGFRTRRWRNFFAVYFILSSGVILFDRTGICFQLDKPAIKAISLPFGLGITYYEVASGWMTTVLSGMGFLVFVYAFWIGLNLYRRDKNRARPLLASCVVFCIGMCNDALVQMQVYQSIYLVEYTYMAIVLMMTYFLSLEVVKSAEIKEAVEAAYRKLVETSQMLTGSSEQVKNVTTDINDAISQVYAGTQSQNDHIKNSHRTINDLLANIHNISREAQQGAAITQDTAHRVASNIDVMKQAFGRITNVEQSVAEMSLTMEHFTAHSKKIGSMVDFINDIAQRINVLSLNVAIEATKAGAANSGLMIVSKEIRQLAKNTRDHTKEISDVISDFQTDVGKVKKSMLDGTAHVRELGQTTGLSKSGLDDILRLIEDEQMRLQRISSKILDLRAYSHQVEKEMGTVADVSENNLRTAERVNAGTREMSYKMAELARLAVSLREAVSDDHGAVLDGA
jgi:methyl-accepting chemotaxis protein